MGYFHVINAWSKAGIGTSIILESSKTRTRIVLDLGATPSFPESINARHVLLSHGHMDHIGAIFNHARAHTVTCGADSVPTYYVPLAVAPKIERAREVLSDIDACNDGTGHRNESLISMNIVGVSPGDEIALKSRKGGESLFIRAFAVDHGGHPALGYIIGNRIPGGLKAEYRGLSGQEIGKLARSGINVRSDPSERIEVGYTGDTCAAGIMGGCGSKSREGVDKSTEFLYQAFRAPLLFCELTFLSPGDANMASSRGHMHISDIESVLASHGIDYSSLQSRIVFFHLSSRHQPAIKALDLICANLHPNLISHCDVAIESIMCDAEKEEGHILSQLVRKDGCVSLGEYVKNREPK